VSWRRLGVIACALLTVTSARAATAECDTWPQWQRFKQLYVSGDGRVIDASSTRQVTVSEGQSYALLFALIANDPAMYAKILRWTQNNLSGADLTRTLPAWQWGRSDAGTWGVLDQNSASDADLWIAYSLLQAGSLWHDASYRALGQSMSDRILAEEVAWVPGLGPTLLPAPKGFVEHQTWRLNASYLPLQVLRAIGRSSGNRVWRQLLESSQKVIVASARHGAAADWIGYRQPDGFVTDSQTQGIGGYDAIRVYLWAGTLSDSDPALKLLSRQFASVIALAAARPSAPEILDTDTLRAHGDGSPGFSAALMPLLSRANAQAALQAYHTHVSESALQSDQHYYSDALSLFGLGWIEGRYRFDGNGELKPQWTVPCTAR